MRPTASNPAPGRAARGRLARALRSHSGRLIESARRETHFAVVRQANPLQVEIEDHGLVLDEEDLHVTQWVRRYDYDHNLQVGDTVLVAHMPNDDFVVHDVIGTGKAEAGLDLANVSASSDPSGAQHVIKKVPMLDDAGNILGYVPIYGSLT
jgi:hypothetical protein